MGKIINMMGQRFGRLVVISEAGRDKGRHILWLCRCSCGKEKIISGGSLRSGKTQSCGCLQKEKIRERSLTHGLSSHPIFGSWRAMISRCYRSKDRNYKNYGGRGIVVCLEWRSDPAIFCNWALENGWEEGLTVDRINNNKNYCPENCQFISLALNSVKQRVLSIKNTSGYKGVSWDKRRRKYIVQITIRGEQKRLGSFNNPKLAAMIYDRAARYAGDNRSVNFKE